jgi:hypothetical protein
MLAVAALSAVKGCANPFAFRRTAEGGMPPNAEAKEVEPTLTTVRDSGTFALKSLEDPDAAPSATIHLSHRERIGFQRHSDGSLVAIAGKNTFPLPPGTFGWVTSESKRAESRREVNERTTEAMEVAKNLTIAVTAGLVFCAAFILKLMSKSGD